MGFDRGKSKKRRQERVKEKQKKELIDERARDG